MTHVPKSSWPLAFSEGKKQADAILELNRAKKAFKRTTADDLPTDRELALSACVQIFYAYKGEQEASAAARRIALEKAERLLKNAYGEDLEPRRVAKSIRKILARTEGEGMLMIWEKVQKWLSVATQPAYWAQFESDPSTVVIELVADLARAAQQGEDSGEETEIGRSEEIAAGREASPEGDPSKADAAAGNAALEVCEQARLGSLGAPEAVRGGGEGLESAPGAVQERSQEPGSAAEEG